MVLALAAATLCGPVMAAPRGGKGRKRRMHGKRVASLRCRIDLVRQSAAVGADQHKGIALCGTDLYDDGFSKQIFDVGSRDGKVQHAVTVLGDFAFLLQLAKIKRCGNRD